MGKPDIESWIASTSADDADIDVEADEAFASWEEARDDWPTFISQAQRQLLSSGTKSRSSFINDQLIPLSTNAGQYATCPYLVNFLIPLKISHILKLWIYSSS